MNLRAYRAFSAELTTMACEAATEKLAWKTPKPESDRYEKTKDYALSGATGALSAAGITRLGQRISGKLISPEQSATHFRAAAPIGLSVGLADALYRQHKKKMQKNAMLSSSTFTPARQAQAETEVRSFNDKQIHKGSTPRAAGLLGGGLKLKRPGE